MTNSGDSDRPEPGDEDAEPGRFGEAGRDFLTGPAPPPLRIAQIAHDHVNRAELKFKDFRVDREGIEIALAQSVKNGDLTQEEGRRLFLDAGDVVSLPLARRYVEMREFELLAKYLRIRLHYHGQTRMTPRNRLILDGMIEGGEAAMAVSLVRLYLKKVLDYTQLRWRAAGRRPSKDMTSDLIEQFERDKARELRELPANLEIAELELAELETYITEHGSREDNRALEKFREELAKVRKRFNLA